MCTGIGTVLPFTAKHETLLTNFVLRTFLAPDSEARCGRTTLPICTLFVGTVPTEANV